MSYYDSYNNKSAIIAVKVLFAADRNQMAR